MFTGHEHRVHALKMLLLSMRSQDPNLHDRYARLSDLWVTVAERRERIATGSAVGLSWPPVSAGACPTGAWRSIDSAPHQEEVEASATAWGPRIWLRNREQAAMGRWRAYGPALDAHRAKSSSREAGWEDLDGKPLAFTPTEWRELGS